MDGMEIDKKQPFVLNNKYPNNRKIMKNTFP